MRILLAASICLALTGMASKADARNLCDTLEAMSRVEDASRRFLSSPSVSDRRDALDAMSREFASAEAADLSPPGFDRIRGVLASFMQSRRQVLDKAESAGVASAIASARTAAYAGHGAAFDAVYQPLRCHAPRSPLSRNIADGNRAIVSDSSGISAQNGFVLSASTMAYTAFALLILGGAGFRGSLELRARRNRRSKRYHCAIDTGIRRDGWRYDARLHDISQVGCKLQTKAKLAIGEQLVITLLGAEQQGRIVWANRHYTGVEFTKRLTASQVERVITAKPAKTGPRILGKRTQTASKP